MSVLKPELIGKKYGKGVNEPLNPECEKSKKALLNTIENRGGREKEN